MCFVSIDNTHARDPLSVTFAARAMSYMIEWRHLQSTQRAQSGQAISVLLTPTKVHFIANLATYKRSIRQSSSTAVLLRAMTSYRYNVAIATRRR